MIRYADVALGLELVVQQPMKVPIEPINIITPLAAKIALYPSLKTVSGLFNSFPLVISMIVPAINMLGQPMPSQNLVLSAGKVNENDFVLVVYVWVVVGIEIETPSSPAPELMSVLLDDSESESALLTISEFLLGDLVLFMHGMMCFPFDELVD